MMANLGKCDNFMTLARFPFAICQNGSGNVSVAQPQGVNPMPRLLKAAFTILLMVWLNLPLAAQSDRPQKKPATEKSAMGTNKGALTFTQRRALELLDQLGDVA